MNVGPFLINKALVSLCVKTFYRKKIRRISSFTIVQRGGSNDSDPIKLTSKGEEEL